MTKLRFILLVAALTGCPNAKEKGAGYSEPVKNGAALVDIVDKKACTKDEDTRSIIFESRTFYFCSVETAEAFWSQPGKYIPR